MRKETFVCDVCGIEKGKENNWFLGAAAPVFHIFPWNDENTQEKIHLCGQNCAHKALDQYFKEVGK